MLISREGSKKKEYCCDRCSAQNGKKHPSFGFVVNLRKEIIGGRMMALCQKCNTRVHARTRFNHLERTRAPSTEQVKSRVHDLFNP